jgi:hypothetical protein
METLKKSFTPHTWVPFLPSDRLGSKHLIVLERRSLPHHPSPLPPLPEDKGCKHKKYEAGRQLKDPSILYTPFRVDIYLLGLYLLLCVFSRIFINYIPYGLSFRKESCGMSILTCLIW